VIAVGSNTAERWWVRLAARWVARVDAVTAHLNLAFQAMTGVSLASGALKYFGYQQYVPYFLAITGVGTLCYAYLYAEGGVWNQTARDKTDLSTNYSGPTMLMDAKLEARQLSRLAYVLQNGSEQPLEEIEQEMEQITVEEWVNLRDGVDITELEQEYELQ